METDPTLTVDKPAAILFRATDFKIAGEHRRAVDLIAWYLDHAAEVPPTTTSLWMAINGGRSAIACGDIEAGARLLEILRSLRGRTLRNYEEVPLTRSFIREYPKSEWARFEAQLAAGETHVKVSLSPAWDHRADEALGELERFVGSRRAAPGVGTLPPAAPPPPTANRTASGESSDVVVGKAADEIDGHLSHLVPRQGQMIVQAMGDLFPGETVEAAFAHDKRALVLTNARAFCIVLGRIGNARLEWSVDYLQLRRTVVTPLEVRTGLIFFHLEFHAERAQHIYLASHGRSGFRQPVGYPNLDPLDDAHDLAQSIQEAVGLLARKRSEELTQSRSANHQPPPPAPATSGDAAVVQSGPAPAAGQAATPDDRQPEGGIAGMWASDPTGRHHQRWWSGTAWTDHVAGPGGSALDVYQETAVATGQSPDHLTRCLLHSIRYEPIVCQIGTALSAPELKRLSALSRFVVPAETSCRIQVMVRAAAALIESARHYGLPPVELFALMGVDLPALRRNGPGTGVVEMAAMLAAGALINDDQFEFEEEVVQAPAIVAGPEMATDLMLWYVVACARLGLSTGALR